MTDDLTGLPSIHRLAVQTSDGLDLRAEIASPVAVAATVVACHPHPLHGGSMYANVVEALFTGLPPLGAAVMRFNFRGVSGSEGRYDRGRGERLDVLAAVDEMDRRWPEVDLLLAGYSFGAEVAMAVDHRAVAGWLLVAPPLTILPAEDLVALGDQRPKTFVVGANDQYCSPDRLAERLAGSPNTRVVEVEGADHFFGAGLDQVLATAATAIGQ
jgi:alpha/beta superfamily hydrolase